MNCEASRSTTDRHRQRQRPQVTTAIRQKADRLGKRKRKARPISNWISRKHGRA